MLELPTKQQAEQRIRADSLTKAGYLEQRDIGTLTPEILSGWLEARLGTSVDRRRAVLDGLIRVPQLAAELLQPAIAAGAPANVAAVAVARKGGATRVAV